MTTLPTDATITYQQQYRKCGKPNSCASCRLGKGHGPYWYAYWRVNGKLKSGYVGKNAPQEKDVDSTGQHDVEASHSQI